LKKTAKNVIVDCTVFLKEKKWICKNTCAICAVMYTTPPRGTIPAESRRGPLLRIFLPTGYAPSAEPGKTSFHPRIKICRCGGFFMLSREDFIFTIGSDGPAAVIDSQAKKRYGALSTRELAGKGLFRAAYASAVYSKTPEEKSLVAEAYSRLTGSSIDTLSLDRLFGVFPVEVRRSVIL
jgi:hypothetical protein